MKTKRILLIIPPFYRLMGSHFNGIQLGLSYIAAVLNGHGHEVGIYNTDYHDSDHYLNQRQIFENYKAYKEILNDINNPIWREIADNIMAFSPDVVGISMYTATYKSAKNVALLVKGLDRNIKVVVGGTHPTLDPHGVVKNEEYDYVIRGEGEFTFLELVDGRNEGEILGLTYKNKKGDVINNKDRPFIEDLDKIPFPLRDSFINATDKMHTGFVITGRGCPFACTYCASPKKWNRKTRFRSVDNVIDELKFLNGNHSSQEIYFVDDTFTINRERTKEICRRLVKDKIKIQWRCDTRADCLDRELIFLMKEAGCNRIKIGVESGSDRILKMIQKGITKKQIYQTVSLIKEARIPLTVYLMAGFPGETDNDLKETIELAKEINAEYYSLSILAPYYGTQIYKELELNGGVGDKKHWEYFFHQSGDMIVNRHLNPTIVDEFLSLNERNGKGRRI